MLASSHQFDSAERLQGCHPEDGPVSEFAYENASLAIDEEASPRKAAALATDSSERAASRPEPKVAALSAASSYALSALQASCWLRQLLCLSLVDDAAAIGDAADADTEAQLAAMLADFELLTPPEQGAVQPERLHPPRLRFLRARQRAAAACVAEALAMSRQRRTARESVERAVAERLAGCHQRLQLVSRCAVGLASRRQRSVIGGGSGGDTAATATSTDDEVDRDLRLLEDSAARARRNIGEALETLAADGPSLGRRATRRLGACAACLEARAAGLAQFAEAERQRQRGLLNSGDSAELHEEDEGKGDDVIAVMLQSVRGCVADAIDSATAAAGSFDADRLEKWLVELERNEELIGYATAAVDEATELSGVGAPAADDSDSDSEEGLRAAAAPGSQQLRLRQDQRLRRHQQLVRRLTCAVAAVRRPLSALAEACRTRRDLTRGLAVRALRLRHLCELARASGAVRPAEFLIEDETEATEPTTPELLAGAADSLGRVLELSRRLAVDVGAADGWERRLDALARACERALARADASREEFESLSAGIGDAASG